MRTPRSCSQSRRAPVTTARTTSLTVPPRVSLIRLKVASSERAQTKRRCGPIGWFSGTSGAGSAKRADELAEPLERLDRPCGRSSPGCGSPRPPARRAAAASRRVASPPCATRSEVLGSGRGTQSSASSTGCGTGSRSKSTVPMSTPEMPSTIAWWVLVRIAKRSRSRPCTSHSSQSGFERSSCCEKTRRRAASAHPRRPARAARCGGCGRSG